jgi:ZIP family zinc transporter
MAKAALYGFIASGALLIGAVVAALLRNLPEQDQRTVEKVNKAVMAFGAGVLLCTLSFELMEEAFQMGGYDHATIGFLAGALLFVLGDLWLDRKGSGWELLLGALLDGIPESAVIGVGLLAGKGLGLLMMIAVFLSNLPEGLSGARNMLNPSVDKQKSYSTKDALIVWASVTLICTLSSIAGYRLLGKASASVIATMLAIAAGAMLAMVAHTMIPEAFSSLPKRPATGETGRRKRKLRIYDKVEAMATVAGFLVTFILSRLTK